METYPPPIVIDREKEQKGKEVLNSNWHYKQFQYLTKWKEYNRKHNSWKPAFEVSAPDLTVDFYCRHLGAPKYICWTEFKMIFHPGLIASRYSNLREGYM